MADWDIPSTIFLLHCATSILFFEAQSLLEKLVMTQFFYYQLIMVVT
jgi:hypothetical protein